VVPAPPAVVLRLTLNCEVPPTAIDAGVKDFETVGPFTTTNESDAAVPVPAFVVVIGPVLLTYVGWEFDELKTSTVIVQVVLAGIVPPVNARLRCPFVAAMVPVQPAEMLDAVNAALVGFALTRLLLGTTG
jgi:hypothetical protein